MAVAIHSISGCIDRLIGLTRVVGGLKDGGNNNRDREIDCSHDNQGESGLIGNCDREVGCSRGNEGESCSRDCNREDGCSRDNGGSGST